MNDYIVYEKIAKMPVRLITIIYALVKFVFYFAAYPDYALSRLVSGTVMIVFVFMLTSSNQLTRRKLSVLVPYSLAVIELATVSLFDGDRLTYIFLIGCSLLSLLYANVTGLFITMFLTSTTTAFMIFVLDIRLLGLTSTLDDEIFNFAGVIVMYILIFLQGNFSVGALDRFRRTGKTFDAVLNTSSNLMVIVNDRARVEYISKSFAEIVGIEKREYAVGLPVTDIFPTVDLKIFFGGLLELKGSFEKTFEIEMKGRRHYFMLHSSPIGESGIARVFDCVDITMMTEAKNEKERFMTKQIEIAEEASKSKTSFLATMSHEIRTPMNAILGISQIELQKKNIPEEYAVALEKIHSSGNNLLGIINDILDMSKIETGKLQLNPVAYDVPSFINDTVQLNIVRIGSKPINFIMDVNESLPSTLNGDELRIKQILNNLLSNAIKYTESGYVKLSVSHVKEGESVILSFIVEDTGQGMKPEDQERLFSEFVRFNEDVNRSTEGTGLGLSITKRLVEMMDGTITVKSEYNKGSTFTVTIKQKSVNCPPIGEELAARLSNFMFVGHRQAEKLRISREVMPYGSVLVVDDVNTNLYVAEGLLKPYELKIETAGSGFEAIDKINGGAVYDVVFMDHMMPQMDGIETTGKLRAGGYTGVIVALTANALVGNKEMFAQKGFDDFIPKPIDVRLLNEVLNKFIRDMYPEEAKKYRPEAAINETAAASDPRLIKAFLGDAKQSAATLRKTAANGDIKLLTTTAHAMKAALINIGEHEASALAWELENAGLNGNTEYIAANIETFIKTLEDLIDTLASGENNNNDDIIEDKAYLSEQLQIVKSACDDYDITTACSILDGLKEKPWTAKTLANIEKIYDTLYIGSDFEKAAEMIETL